MGQGTPAILANAGGSRKVWKEHTHEFGEMVLAAAQTAFSTNRAAAVLVSQRVIGAKDFEAKEEHQ